MGRAYQVRAASMAKTAAAKSKLNAKYGTLIYIAAKSGLPDPDLNINLKRIIEKAKKDQVSAEVIKRAIDKAKGGSAENFDFVRYEGFGPNNAMFIVECLTNNTNRTYTEVRTAFMKCGFKLGVDGSVIHMFDNKAVFSFERFNDEETLEILVDAGCDVDDLEYEDGLTTVYAPIGEYAKIRDALTIADPNINFLEDQVLWLPQMYTSFTEDKDWEHLERFKTILDEIDDVQDMYHNVKRDEE